MVPSIKAIATVSSSQGGEVEVINAFSKKPKPIAQPTGILKQQGVRVKPNERFVVREELGKASHQQVSPSQTPEEIAEEEARGPIVKIDKRSFEDAWKDYAEQVKHTHEASFYTLLTTNIPDLSENTIDLSLNNNTQPPLLERYRSELLGHLREKLQAPGLELKFRVLEAEEGDARPYSDKEKYEAMKEKNPALEKLRLALNLDLEF